MKKVAIIMGSDSDWPVVKGACTVLKDFGVPYEAHILSAHRTPEAAAAFARSARAEGYGVILCAAGMAAHLAGAFAANTTLPVVGIPMKGGAMDGLDALLAKLDEMLSDRVHTLKVLLPYDKLGLAAPMRERGSVQVEEYREDGLYLEGIVKTEDLHCFEGYLV